MVCLRPVYHDLTEGVIVEPLFCKVLFVVFVKVKFYLK